jgi:hypothetical protein
MGNGEVFVRRTGNSFKFSNDLTSAANVVHADEKLTAFLELESARASDLARFVFSIQTFILFLLLPISQSLNAHRTKSTELLNFDIVDLGCRYASR